MKKLVVGLVMIGFCLGLTACKKDDEKKNQDEAQVLVQEQNALVIRLNGKGLPAYTWTDAELNDYERDLNRLAAVENRLEQLNGEGVTVYGGDNDNFVQTARQYLAIARAKKKSAANVAPGTLPVDTTTHGSDDWSAMREQLDQKLNAFNQIADQVIAMGQPSAEWTDVQLNAYISKLDELDKANDELMDWYRQAGVDTWELESSKDSIRGIREKAQELLEGRQRAG